MRTAERDPRVWLAEGGLPEAQTRMRDARPATAPDDRRRHRQLEALLAALCRQPGQKPPLDGADTVIRMRRRDLNE